MEKRNYQREMEAEIARLEGRRPALLLHSCCGPCSSAVLERLTEHFRVTLLYYNPNIEPEEEYLRRKAEQERLLGLLTEDIPMLECPYGHEAFAAFAPAMAEEPEGGKRCLACFRLRLRYTAERAKENGFEYFTTTLSVSPHKNAEALNRIGEEAGAQAGVKYLFADFKKKNGYLRSLELSREYGLYRQDYCGCLYSKTERE
uniref:Epoxyqueuosine reductase QueH n=1 Tax=uncultured bacterium Contig87 TaxID=1393621 RepID=W0FNX1_9BACT|nr:DNA integration/recombination/inversion protein [uncultured bacterium Contig87]